MATQTRSEEPMQRGAKGLVGLLLGIGLLSRIAPFFDQGGRLLQQFPTEDGYLMLTIARNLGIGNGMSIADGTIATNGTQPLSTLVWAAVFGLVDGDKAAGVAGVLWIELLVAIASAGMLYLLGRRLLAGRSGASGIAAVAAAAWFASAQTARHSMNCLETGIYVLAVTSFCWALLRLADGAPARPALGRWAVLGALLGVAFWARIDAVLLCVAVGVTHLAGWLPVWRAGFRDRFFELAAAGCATGLVAAPWLIHNFVLFGSIMPVSGQSEGFRVAFAQELPLVPAKLVEYLMVVVQIPNPLETHPAMIWGASGVLVLAGIGVARAFKAWPGPARSIASMGAVFGAGLILWYGVFFGAGHFMSRYLFPTAPLLAVLTTASLAAWLQRAPSRAIAGWVLALSSVLMTAGLNARVYAGGDHHEHSQVVTWIEENVPDDVWVGATQTGAIGFFHDKTINLDGKVNPAAMVARRAKAIPQYIVDSPIQYLVDWKGITNWIRHYPEISENFEILVADDEQNLGVLARHGAPRKERGARESTGATAISRFREN